MKKLLIMFVMLLGSVATTQAQSFSFECRTISQAAGFSEAEVITLMTNGFTSRTIERANPLDNLVGFTRTTVVEGQNDVTVSIYYRERSVYVEGQQDTPDGNYHYSISGTNFPRILYSNTLQDLLNQILNG